MIEQAALIGLAAWRAAALLSYERGPFDVFLRFRKALGFQHGDNGEPTSWPEHWLTNALSCVWCLGIWSAVAMYGVWQLEPRVVLVAAAASVVVGAERVARG